MYIEVREISWAVSIIGQVLNHEGGPRCQSAPLHSRHLHAAAPVAPSAVVLEVLAEGAAQTDVAVDGHRPLRHAVRQQRTALPHRPLPVLSRRLLLRGQRPSVVAAIEIGLEGVAESAEGLRLLPDLEAVEGVDLELAPAVGVGGGGGGDRLVLLVVLGEHVPLELVAFEVVDLLLEELDVGDSALLGAAEVLAADDVDAAVVLVRLLELERDGLLAEEGPPVGQLGEDRVVDVGVAFLEDPGGCEGGLGVVLARNGGPLAPHVNDYNLILKRIAVSIKSEGLDSVLLEEDLEQGETRTGIHVLLPLQLRPLRQQRSQLCQHVTQLSPRLVQLRFHLPHLCFSSRLLVLPRGHLEDQLAACLPLLLQSRD